MLLIGNVLNCTLVNLAIYFDNLGLTLSAEKSKCMFINKPQTKVHLDNIHVVYRGQEIETVKTFKYLEIDDQFSFIKFHANNVECNTCHALSFLHRYKRMLTSRIFALFVNTYVHCLSIWCVANSFIDSIQSKVNNLLITCNYPK